MYSSTLFLTSALEGGEGSASRSGRTLTSGIDPVPIVQEAGWASEPVWTGAENLAPTGIRSPHRPARRQSLYRLRYPATIYAGCNSWKLPLGRPRKIWEANIKCTVWRALNLVVLKLWLLLIQIY